MKKLLFLFVFLTINNYLFTQQYIIKFKSGFSDAKIKEIIQENLIQPIFNNFSKIKREKLQNIDIFNLFYTTNNINQIKNKYAEYIEYIEPNYIFKVENDEKYNDTYFNQQWNLEKIKAFEAWQTATGDGILVGIIDTGIDYYHPDLINQIFINKSEDLNENGQIDPWSSDVEIDGIKGDFNGIDDDGNGFIDDVIGYDFVDQYQINIGDSQMPDPDPKDEMGHGTSVSGIIAAQANNNIGIVGVAYNCKILPIRAFDATGNAESDDIAKAIIYATLQGAKVLNFSFGEIYPSKLIHEAIKFAYKNKVVMVASSGNNNWDLNHYPSDFEEVISVTSINNENKRSSNGNYGNRLNLAAPGTNIYTTLIDSTYGYKSGTSFAAPHVSAAAALILEQKPNLTPPEIAGILESSTIDLGPRGWDYQYASGLLNCREVLNQYSSTILTIDYPENNTFLNRDSNKLSIIGSVLTPLFDNFEVFIGKGLNPKNWDQISLKNTKQILSDTIALIPFNNLEDTLYTIKIVVNLKNLSTLEKRFYINLYSSNTHLKIININPILAFYKNKKIILFNAITNYPCNFKIKYKKANSSEDFKEINEMNKFKIYHQIPLEETLENSLYEAIAIAELDNGFKIEQNFTFLYEREIIPENNNIYPKNYGLPLSYLLNDVADFYNNGKDCIAINDLSNGDWGNIKIYEFDSTEFYLKDHLNYKWLPKGIGDSNGDGLPEIFATSFKQSVLFQAKSEGESPFSKILFSDTLSLNFWAEDILNLDSDAKEELIAYSDTAFFALKYINGQYKLIATANPNNYISTFPGFTANDFDNDGATEILFGNRQGNIYIFEFSNNTFAKEYENLDNISSSEQYITNGNFIDKNSKEIIIGNFGSSTLYGKEDTGESIWSFRVLKFTENKYQFIDTIFIYGVRGGLEYKNGISSGDLDNDGIDELIISTFPNLYIFKWDYTTNSFKPIWVYPYTYSNTAIIHDFDKNGINEIGFTTFSSTRFFEFNLTQKPDVPLNLNGWAENQTTAILKWDAVNNAEYYEILRMEKDKDGYVGYQLGLTSSNNYKIDTLQPNFHYNFVVRAVNESLNEKYSDISNLISIYTYPRTKIKKVDYNFDNQIIVTFTNKIKNNINPNCFKIIKLDSNLDYIPAYSQYFSDSTILLSFSNNFEAGYYIFYSNTFTDYFNNPTLKDSITFSINNTQKPIELYITNLSVENPQKIILFFSEKVDEKTATALNNYQILPYGNIENITLNDDKKSLTIILKNRPPLLANGMTYTITCKNIKSIEDHKITEGPGNSISFVFFAESLSDVYTYPAPFSLSKYDHIYFANLPPEAEIHIFDINQSEINTLSEYDGNGGLLWNLYDKNGNKIREGLYFYKVIETKLNGQKNESKLYKFIILP